MQKINIFLEIYLCVWRFLCVEMSKKNTLVCGDRKSMQKIGNSLSKQIFKLF